MNIQLAPEILFHIGSFPVTNSFFWLIFLCLFLMVSSILINKNLKKIPGRFQSFIEVLIDGAYKFVRTITGSDEKAKKIFPLVFTMFILILTANLFTYIPGQSAVTVKNEEGVIPLFRAVMSDYGLVFVMTTVTIVLTQIVAIAVHGPFGYLGKFINIKGIKDFIVGAFKGKFNFAVLAQGFLDFFLGIMDIVGEVAKVVSLSFRLFGNMFAGEVLSSVMLFIGFNVVSVAFLHFTGLIVAGNAIITALINLPFMFLGLLTAVVQAFVFSVLTLIFITMASEIDESKLKDKAVA